MLRKRLKVEEYECDAPFTSKALKPTTVRIKLKQHAGKPALPTVKPGDKVKPGDNVGRVPDQDLGASVHSSIAGTVKEVTNEAVVIHA